MQIVSKTFPLPQGFSLPDVLITLAVLGILLVVAFPNIANINSYGSDTKNRRNAQTIAGVFAAASAAGLNFAEGKSDKIDVIEAVIEGGIVSEGPMQGAAFSVPVYFEGTKAEVKGVARYLNFDEEQQMLFFHAEGANAISTYSRSLILD